MYSRPVNNWNGLNGWGSPGSSLMKVKGRALRHASTSQRIVWSSPSSSSAFPRTFRNDPLTE
ncbi:hypothetical protein T02_14497 [Trichinella nativa]|uniref:Uncharacterized protein n=1 Tax=Trichinella nativa TaxID=6335 RepID=A0A0V1KJI8_9BILA|nr:hypothetical protein T02_14497 [Trichinella nativa]